MSLTLSNLTTLAMVAMGLALFLLGMRQLENGIRSLGYDTFKRWLSRSTSSAAGSAAVGMAVTATLQSSSMVSLLVLAFASANVLPLYNAIGMLLGANVGTTVTGWMVATIGFKLSLQVFALPLMATGALMQLLSSRLSGVQSIGVAVFGIGLIIFGLDTMKDAVADLPQHWDLGILKGHGAWLYFLVGAAIAAMIQSSSATMMITLAALNTGLLDLTAAAALVIGADLGTTSTTVLGSIGGNSIKRQLALAHFLFNLVVDLVAFFVLLPFLPELLKNLSLQDPLYSLVAFHSLFNLLGLLIFLPLLKPFSSWISRRFLLTARFDSPLLGQPTAVPDAALMAMASVLSDMRLSSVVLTLHAFRLRPEQLQLTGPLQDDLVEHFEHHTGPGQRYTKIKQEESDLLAFSFNLQEQPLSPEQVLLLGRQTHESRALVYSSKTLQDIREDLVTLRHSAHAEVITLYKAHRNFIRGLYSRYLPLAGSSAALSLPAQEALTQLMDDNERHYQEANHTVHAMASSDVVGGTELSTMLNVNREIHHALKNLFSALE